VTERARRRRTATQPASPRPAAAPDQDQIRSTLVGQFAPAAPSALSQVASSSRGPAPRAEQARRLGARLGTADIEAVCRLHRHSRAFATLDTQLDAYTQTDGMIPGARKQMTEQATRLTDSIANMQNRLAVRRAALQREFIAADAAMSQLQGQSGSLANFGASL
jgi:flagellar capping protein FliD